jgi:hypothetical protein
VPPRTNALDDLHRPTRDRGVIVGSTRDEIGAQATREDEAKAIPALRGAGPTSVHAAAHIHGVMIGSEMEASSHEPTRVWPALTETRCRCEIR